MSVCGPTGMESQMRILTVAQDDRWELHPEVPTLKELGYPIKGELYYSLWAPKGTPKEVVDKIYSAFKRALEENREEITKRGKAGNQIIFLSGPDELWKTYRDSYDFYKRTIERMGPSSK